MSNISRLSQIIDSAYINNDIQLMRDSFNEYQVSHCYYPRMILVNDAHTQSMRQIPVSCGSCYHCIESKINEWVTRMYAHAEDFMYVYFITLTYRSFVDFSSPVSSLIINKLKDAIWHKDTLNKTKHYSYNPCLLVKSHYQNFLKRLRKNTGAKVSYVLSGEYGHDFGRPHFHMILFSDKPITRADVLRAWSICLWRSNNGTFSYRTNQKFNGQPYDFPIGRVDYHDLVSNGSFNTYAKVRVDGNYLDVSNCFAYVCKYVCKRDNVNFNRLNLAYNSLYVKKDFCNVFNNEISFDIAKDYLLKVGYLKTQINSVYQNLKQLVYEKVIFEPSDKIYKDGISQFQRKSLFGHPVDVEMFPSIYFEFRDSFSPFCEFSRGCSIGSVYADRNIKEFAQGVFTKPLLQTASYVLPKYFVIKAKEYLYGLRRLHKTFKSSSYNLGGLIDLYRQFSAFLSQDIPLRDCHDYKGCFDSLIKAFQNDLRCYYDKHTKERIVFGFKTAYFARYSRKEKRFVLIRTQSLKDFVSFWYKKLGDELDRYNKQLSISDSNFSLQERTFLKMLDCGLEFPKLRDDFVKRQNEYLHDKQKDYDQLHSFVE